MKSLVPWVCFFVASASPSLFAQDDFKAYRLGHYNKAAAPLLNKTGKDAVADYYLGRLYLYGYGQLKNNELAMHYFTKSAEKGYLPSIRLMAKYSLLQDKNPQQAVTWFKQAAALGDVEAQLFMAAAYKYGIGVKKNTDLATHFVIDAAKNGNAIAQFDLAESFIDSRHSSNHSLGLIWLNKSANQENPRALTKLGTLYLQGKLLPKDREKGINLLEKSAAKGYVPAMLALSDLALAEQDPKKAQVWLDKAVNKRDFSAYLHLAHACLQEKSPLHDVHAGFLWTLKAAQEGYAPAKKDLANLYAHGIGVATDAALAKQWSDQAIQDSKTSDASLAQAALWLSNDTQNKMEETPYALNGIFSAWHNSAALRNNINNQPPKMEVMRRQEVFKPQFEVILPNEVPIHAYYDALLRQELDFQANQWTYPRYKLNPQIEALEKANSLILVPTSLPAPYFNANYEVREASKGNLMDTLLEKWTYGWQKQAKYMAVFTPMYFKALLGDSQSQFEIGQMFQYGLGVEQNHATAIVFYQNAAEQQHLASVYNLGILYLKNAKNAQDYQTALNWLTDGAFKGNRKCQYVLARLLDQGKVSDDGKEFIKPNPDQAKSMLYLSAANHYGPAQYELGQRLAREMNGEFSVIMRQYQLALIRELYQGAVANRVAQALLPLAFYNAMDVDKKRQAYAFKVAQEQAQAGDSKAALLLGLLYDRGIGVAKDQSKAIHWYQQEGQNSVSQFILGTYIAQGQGVVKDRVQGMDSLQQSANAQFSYADFNLAVLKQQAGQDFLGDLIRSYALGNSHAGILLADYYVSDQQGSSPVDPEKIHQAQEIYAGLAKKGDQWAQLKWAYLMDKGLAGKEDPLAAQQWYTASAEQDNPIAQYSLGQFYQLGVLGTPDYGLAKEWYQKAAPSLAKASLALGFIDETVDDNYQNALKAYEQAEAKGNSLAAYNLGLMYAYGKGVPVDYSKAKSLFLKAANQGVEEAMNQVASLYFYGLGQERNEQEALFWYKKAAHLGNGNALYALGLLSETGVASKLDLPLALKYYQQASNKENEKAMLALARMYHYGLGVAKDQKISAAIYQKLADRQNAYAQYQLGTYYLEGPSEERLPEKGRELLKQASKNGSSQARKTLLRLEAQLQERVSFIEPLLQNRAGTLSGDSLADITGP